MAHYEYKVLYGSPAGSALMPWASQKIRDEIGRGSFEKKLNKLAEDGWEVVSTSTNSVGSLLWMGTRRYFCGARRISRMPPENRARQAYSPSSAAARIVSAAGLSRHSG